MIMKVEIMDKSSFSVIGKLGQGHAKDSLKWIPPIWQEANRDYNEISNLAKLDNEGNIVGFWGAMSDVDERFERWQEEGKYLAGCEVTDDAVAPKGWVKWIIPAFKYAVVKCTQDTYKDAFGYMLKDYLPQHEYHIVGAIHEYYDPKDTHGELSLYFPIEKKAK
jgi:predicted transcriptional regulator YdeE